MSDLINENAENAESNTAALSSSAHQNETETNDDTDADAFAILSLLFITAATIVYYLSY